MDKRQPYIDANRMIDGDLVMTEREKEAARELVKDSMKYGIPPMARIMEFSRQVNVLANKVRAGKHAKDIKQMENDNGDDSKRNSTFYKETNNDS